MKRLLVTFLGAVCSSAIYAQTSPQSTISSQAIHGGTGLIQTPTARMDDEGEFYFNYSDNDQYRFWSVSVQLFPWMQATARYTDVRNRLYSNLPSFSGDQTLKDKGVDVKFRLLQESFYLPELSVGVRDLGGTGFFSSEYIAASKRWNDFDFHLGMGWGYLGSAGNISNPFCEIDDDFCTRPFGFEGRGGRVDYQKFFKGDASLFAGVEYQTPIPELRLKAEYEGNDYSLEQTTGLIQDSKWNVGASYRWNNFDFGLNYQRGNTLGFNISYRFNLNQSSLPKIQRDPISLNAPPEHKDREPKPLRMAELYAYGGFSVKDEYVEDNQITVYGHQLAYRDSDEAIERIGRVLASRLPNEVKNYKIVDLSSNIPVLETNINADSFKSVARYENLNKDLKDTYVRKDVSVEALEHAPKTAGLNFYTGTELFWSQSLGNPEAFYMYQGGVLLHGGVSYKDNYSLMGSAKVTLIENYDDFNFKVDTQNTPLPRVRTYVREYVTRSKVTLNTLFGHWQDRVGSNLYGQAYGGYLESMFAGVGGELLYRPVDSNWAVGVDINYVQQRSFENDWDLFDYKTFTGHANIYYEPEVLPGAKLALKVGQYLAKDKGVTIDFSKEFDSGITVGAWAALTNVSSEEYGEGSFSKGFYLTIPFDLFSVKPSKGSGTIPWVPIGRDGGQALKRPVSLFNTTADRSR